MFLTWLDLIILLILFLFIAYGFVTGIIQAIGAIVGLFLGAWLAGQYYVEFGNWIGQYIFSDAPAITSTIAFIVLFTLVQRLTGLVFQLINRVFNVISIIPFTRSANRLLGAILGFVEGILAVGLALYFIAQYDISPWVNDIIAGSQFAGWLIVVGGIMAPLLPELIRRAQDILPQAQ